MIQEGERVDGVLQEIWMGSAVCGWPWSCLTAGGGVSGSSWKGAHGASILWSLRIGEPLALNTQCLAWYRGVYMKIMGHV